MTDPLVTMVIPTYSPENTSPMKRLTRSIRSIINCSYPRIEIIVADDGTPTYYGRDLVAEVIENVKEEVDDGEKDITFHHLKFEHRGQSFVLNDGFKAAKGDYVMDLNDDDILMHDFLKYAVEIMEEEENKDVGFLYSKYLYTYNWKEFKEAQPDPEIWNRDRLKEMQIAPVIGLFRAWVAKKVKFDEELDHQEDWDYLLKVSQVTEGMYVDGLYSFVVFLHSEQKSVADEIGVAKCQDIILKRVASGYYDRTEGK